MSKYVKHVTNPETPQIEKAHEQQVKGRAGGYVFKVDDWTRLNRFLILGCENGSYYASEEELTIENYDVILRCLKMDSIRTINTIVEISDQGRAIKNLPAIFALAVCSVKGDKKARTYANQVMPKVARYSTDLFIWVDCVLSLKNNKKGKGLLKAIGRWYTEKSAKNLAYQVCKYPSRSVGRRKISHRDLLRISRIGVSGSNGKSLFIPSEQHSIVYDYAVHRILSKEEANRLIAQAESNGRNLKYKYLTEDVFESLKDGELTYIWAHEKCKNASTAKEIINLIKNYGLTRESVPPDFRNNPEVQEALLEKMPMTALIRNLGGMTASGLLKPLSNATSFVVDKITNEEALQKARIHPMTIIMALRTYSSGHGMRTRWEPVATIKDALDDAFYKAFKYVEPTGQKFLIGIDVSGSMTGFGWGRDQSVLTPREAAAVVAMTIARTEKNYEMMAFCDLFVPLNISGKDSLSTVIKTTSNLPFGGTDCSLPMLYASKNNLEVDVFVVLTDNETWAGKMHPFEALKQYRKKINSNAKLAVLAFESSEFSIADPNDAGMIDIAGLDSNVPKVLSEFAMGRI